MIKNSFFFIGRVVRDPEQKVFQSGNTLTTVCLAVQSRNKDYTDYFDIDMWGKLGETAIKHLKKGRLIAVEGEIRTRTIDTQNGKRKVYDFRATDFRFLDAPVTNNTKTTPVEEEEDLEEDVLENFEETEIEEEKEEQKKVVSMPKKKTSTTTKKTKTPVVEETEEVEDDLPF